MYTSPAHLLSPLGMTGERSYCALFVDATLMAALCELSTRLELMEVSRLPPETGEGFFRCQCQVARNMPSKTEQARSS